MKITDISGLYVGYSKKDNFRILIAANDKKEAKDFADSYAEDSKLGTMEVEELTEDDLDAQFDCDYLVS